MSSEISIFFHAHILRHVTLLQETDAVPLLKATRVTSERGEAVRESPIANGRGTRKAKRRRVGRLRAYPGRRLLCFGPGPKAGGV